MMTLRQLKKTLVALASTAAAAATMVGMPSDASACGGLFCAGGGPQAVNQAAERIIFAQHPDGQITTVVQIMYEGPTDRFGWILPVPGVPEVGLSSDAAFTSLQNATNPTYQMNTTVEGECKEPSGRLFGNGGVGFESASDGATNNASVNNDTGVSVLDEGSAGPYDYVVIQVDAEVENNVQLALDWLEENNYETTNVGPDLIKPYLDDGKNLLAVRLQKSADSGAVRPLKLKYEDTHPMVPIKLTAVAANDDMGVLVWVLGEERAIPKNYKHLEINDALIDWFQPNAVYNQVISVAANEASGQGFVTEWAQPADQLNATMFSDQDQANWDRIRQQTWTDNEAQLVNDVIGLYANGLFDNFGVPVPWDGLDEAIDQSFPTATAEEKKEVQRCGACAFNGSVPEDFDPETFLMAIDDFVVAPMRETQELFDDAGYVTRLYTTLSAHEMTLDPSFDFNPDLEDVSGTNTAERIIECHKSVEQFEAPWRAELPSGLVVRGEGGTWPFQIDGDEEMPATLTVREIGTSGDGEIVRDNLATVRQALDTHNADIPVPGERGCGCRTANSAPGGSILILVLGLAGMAVRRRRRH